MIQEATRKEVLRVVTKNNELVKMLYEIISRKSRSKLFYKKVKLILIMQNLNN